LFRVFQRSFRSIKTRVLLRRYAEEKVNNADLFLSPFVKSTDSAWKNAQFGTVVSA
jgi:hypothetical protein